MELSYTTQSFGQFGQPNAGFINHLWLVAIDQVTFLGEPGESAYLGGPLTLQPSQLVIDPTALVVQMKFVRQQGAFTENRTTTSDGEEYALQLTTQLPRNETELLAWLEVNKKRRWLAIWTDANGQTYLAGEPGNGMRLTIARIMGQQNAVQLQLQHKVWHTTWLLPDADLATMIPLGQALYNATIN